MRHYTINAITTDEAMGFLREAFPEGRANELNLVFFSTSGTHGTYATIEEVQEAIQSATVDSDCSDEVTFVVFQPRVCALAYGTVKPTTADDINFLKVLRETSWESAVLIGRPVPQMPTIEIGRRRA